MDGEPKLDNVLTIVPAARGSDPIGYRSEFVQLMRGEDRAGAAPVTAVDYSSPAGFGSTGSKGEIRKLVIRFLALRTTWKRKPWKL
ncbi:hypothetical protein MMMDOFMJ_1815 [Methylobacterium gnaphalii]|uniref:Uncharacterized protein n=1 Tax=Methylobacterium gnaphalii TaxID=1010610 RepID=A0A512JEL7_9HYPH|nr:hypothetical protein MGN01_02430 [Methylobacterium gnaphalii]GJD68890.1 hypothetical protein MMMDOFMJ_1815 [Methylobacterium gnaphalii]GLS47413.1 hypothetical protein GCM10007885_02570 [Methylobacterium gnaphalii]